ncbi:MAG: IS630 family transposase, partial [Candidatus Dormibacteraceae bacterium]
MPLPAAPKLVLSESERKHLLALGHHRSTPRGIVVRINIVLGAAEGVANHVLARELSTSLPTVLLWRRRYESGGLAAVVEDRPRSGRPKRISAQREVALVEATIRTTPKDATHWSVRTMAASQKLSPATVQRIWKKHKLQPHRVKSFKFSSDPEFAPKVRDIIGLYLNPPENAIVLSVDEKSQIQALDRTQPILPLRPGLPERQTHDYERHWTTTLFAALNVLEGTVIGQCQPRHRHQEFLRFLDRIDQSIDPHLDIHLVLDNYGTHKHPEVKKWLGQRPRYHVHFTPTGSSWLNQIERWFGEITRKRIRRATFHSVRELVKAIQDYLRQYNKN